MRENDATPKQFFTYTQYILLAIVLVVVACVRVRLLDAPLERDEGEYAYMGQLLLKGVAPYANAYTMKLPGASAAYALIMSLFGQTPAGIHLGLLIVNGISIFLIYLLTRRLLDRDAAVASCAGYAVLSLSQSVFGVFAHATHFVVMFMLAGFILLLRHLDRGRIALLFISGLCFGLAFVMKQHAAIFIVFALLYFIWRKLRNPMAGWRQCISGSSLFLLGAIIPYALIVLCLVQAGVFDKFWFWTVRYASEYVSGFTLIDGLGIFCYQFAKIVKMQLLLWFLAGAGCVFLFTSQGRRVDRLFIAGLLFFSFLSICPGFYFREHYFILLLPAVAILIGVFVTTAGHLLSLLKQGACARAVKLLVLTAAVGYGLYHERDYLFVYTPREVSRALYGLNPFPEAPQIARYIKDHTSGNDRIAVIGSEPEIFFYSDRVSASGHIYMYGLMEDQPNAERMQMEMIREIEKARPKYVVVADVNASWLVRPSSSLVLFDWADKYLAENYEVAGVIDILDLDTTQSLWDVDVKGYTPQSNTFLVVHKRKDQAKQGVV